VWTYFKQRSSSEFFLATQLESMLPGSQLQLQHCASKSCQIYVTDTATFHGNAHINPAWTVATTLIFSSAEQKNNGSFLIKHLHTFALFYFIYLFLSGRRGGGRQHFI